MEKEPFEERMVRVQWPETFIGRWVATTLYGTHMEADVVIAESPSGVMCFESKDHGLAYYETKEVKLMEIKKDYPRLYIRVFVCGSTEEELKERKLKTA
ncbi:MAG: hypothetical protein WDN09_04095 [bacterium]